MKLEKALPALRTGKMIRRACWLNNMYLILKNGKVMHFINHDINVGIKPKFIDLDEGYYIDSEDFLASDWEII